MTMNHITARMLAKQAKLTANELRRIIDYDPETGSFKWMVSRSGAKGTGHIAGTITSRGYRAISVFSHTFKEHRLAWLYVYGQWPHNQIDHSDGDRSNNRIANLREATSSENRCNSVKPSTNKSGIKGVCWYRAGGTWAARIGVAGHRTHLGYFATIEAAADAYARAIAPHHGEFGRFA